MTTVAIDCRFAHLPVGIGRYTRELVARLAAAPGDLSFGLLVTPEGKAWAASLPVTGVAIVSAKHYSLREQWEISSVLKRCSADLLFVPHFNVPFFCPVPFVATIHDLILHRYSNEASLFRRLAYRMLFGHTVRRARKIIAVSAFTASEVRSVYGDAAVRKAVVIPEGVAAAFHRRNAEELQAVLRRYGIRQPFFLYVGNAKQHKNVPLLIDAFVHSGTTDASLVLVTGGREAARLERHDRVRVIPAADDAELSALYSAARAFVTASLYEGFGLPIAEAAACGCPVIAARRGAIPEVAPGGSLLVEPTVEAFAEAFRRPPAPPAPAQQRSWEEAARRTAHVLREACEEGARIAGAQEAKEDRRVA